MYIEGNNGGDYLEISPAGENLVNLEVGHCCVVCVKGVYPIELITSLLSTLDSHTPQWDKAFNSKLAVQIVKE